MNNNKNFDQDRLVERGIDEFIGICKGILFDGIVCYPEAVNLLLWLDNNKPVTEQWLAKEIYQKLPLMVSGNELSSDDEAWLLSELIKITGSPAVMIEGDNPSTQLPLCHPVPDVIFDGRVFVITGNFKMGPRKSVIEAIEDRGGEVILKNVRMDTHYLVIGDIGSGSWMHSTHGRKIEAAVALRERGTGIGIISEANFMKYL